MSLIKPLIKAGKAAAKVEVKDKPFFSAVDKAALELARTKGTGKEFMTELKKVPGVKPAEIQHRKLERIESLPKMEKADFLKELEASPPLNLREDIKLERTPENLEKLTTENNLPDYYDELSDRDREMIDRQTSTYDQYKLPGGSNYREILLQTPTFGGQDLEDLMSLEAMERRGGIGTTYGEERLASLRKKRAEMGDPYLSQHWDGEPNVLAHMRVQDRTGPNGEKILHVEELQSDWHQEGRKKGYKTPEVEARRKELEKLAAPYMNGNRAMPPELFKEIESLPQLNAVPDAPFKKNWHELAMKRLINYAAENGYDSIAITPGAEQAKRYDLSKQISRVVYSPETEMLNAFDNSGKSVLMKGGVAPEQVEKYIGKDPAKRLFDPQNTKTDFRGGKDVLYHEIAGEDLKVGGEGMQGFYDKMIPDYLNSFGKKYGAQVELNSQPLHDMPPLPVEHEPEDIASHAKMAATRLHSFPITPEMREDVTKQGMPLYQQIGIPTGAVGAEAATQNEEPAYAAGGAVYNTNPDMSDGGQIIQGDAFKHGGKVHVTHNTDAMFMDVHDKMFKRK